MVPKVTIFSECFSQFIRHQNIDIVSRKKTGVFCAQIKVIHVYVCRPQFSLVIEPSNVKVNHESLFARRL